MLWFILVRILVSINILLSLWIPPVASCSICLLFFLISIGFHAHRIMFHHKLFYVLELVMDVCLSLLALTCIVESSLTSWNTLSNGFGWSMIIMFVLASIFAVIVYAITFIQQIK